MNNRHRTIARWFRNPKVWKQYTRNDRDFLQSDLCGANKTGKTESSMFQYYKDFQSGYLALNERGREIFKKYNVGHLHGFNFWFISEKYTLKATNRRQRKCYSEISKDRAKVEMAKIGNSKSEQAKMRQRFLMVF